MHVYRITAVVKVKTDIIANIAVSPIGRPVIIVKMSEVIWASPYIQFNIFTYSLLL